jgi:hypothetical protein
VNLAVLVREDPSELVGHVRAAVITVWHSSLPAATDCRHFT